MRHLTFAAAGPGGPRPARAGFRAESRRPPRDHPADHLYAGYTATVRPSSSFTDGIKLRLLREADLSPDRASEFELDHRVALAVGGHPRSLENLALQPWEGASGAKRKDRLERRLQQLVCAGKLALKRAQRALFFDWGAAYLEFLGEK